MASAPTDLVRTPFSLAYENTAHPLNTCYTDSVVNLTLAIEDDLLKQARKLAIDQDTTVNQMVREFLAAQVRQASKRTRAKERLLRFRVPTPAITWTRDELYER